MSDAEQTFVIVGASLAGAKAAEELRTQGFDGRVVLVGEEPEVPYERPPLTKDYLRGESPREKAFVHEPGYYQEHDIELLSSVTATAIDPDKRLVTLDGAPEVVYDRLLLTTGAEPRKLDVAGAGLDGVRYLRTLADCDALKERLQSGAEAVVIGAGWIGAEFAASASQRGLKVTLITPTKVPLEGSLGEELGAFYGDVHRRHGVTLLTETGVETIEGDGAAQSVRTSDGSSLACDFVVVAVGVAPRTALAQGAGATIENGIVVDQRLATSVADVFAAGDVANAWHPFYERRIRSEHWANALNQGPAAARSMLGQEVSYDRLPYFFSDQYDVGMEYSGYAGEWDEIVYRGALLDGAFIAFWLKGGRVVAGMNVNVWDVNDDVQALIRSRREVSADALRDKDTPLRDLAEGR
jgi:3-phenylpropionate/trans-cinnamate dioxygenase ferredoxin reductase subunit